MKGKGIAHNRFAILTITSVSYSTVSHPITRVSYACLMINPHCYIVIITRDRSFGIETENIIGSIENGSLS